MKTFSTLLIVLGAASFAAADTILYTPSRSLGDQRITVHPWGSGTINGEAEEFAYEGTTSIRIATRNLFSGGQVFFGETPDLSKEFDNKNDLLQVTFKVADDSVTSGGGKFGGPSSSGTRGGKFGGAGNGAPIGPQGGPPGVGQLGGGQGGRPPGGFGGPPGGFGQGGRPPGGFGGPPGGFGQGAGGATTTPTLKTLRLVITTTDGLKSEAYVPSDVGFGTSGWRQLGIPLQAITGFGRTNKIIKTIAIGGDATTSVWVGDLRTVVDSTPITGDTNVHDMNLAEGDEVTLTADGYAGASMLKYAWYFDKDTSGLPDATGRAVKHKFNRRGSYTITLIISDYFGLKEPYKTTITAKVN
ncbi:MAG: PKD domain-containing protein [Fimbriimonadaceae bacterium]